MPSLIARLLKDLNTDPITPLIDEYYLKRDHCEDRLLHYKVPLGIGQVRPPGRLSPSSVGGCMRRAAMAFVGVKGLKSKDPLTERVLSRGTWHHHEWQAMFLDMEKVLGEDRFRVIAIEGKVSMPALFIRGSLDVEFEIDSQDAYVLDVKTAREGAFQWRYQNGPDPDHIDQLTTYMRGRKRKKGLMLYDNKGDQTHKVFPVHFSLEVWQRLADWAKDVIAHVRGKEVPERHEACTQGSTMAKRCPFAKYCYSPLGTEEKLQEMMYGGKRARMGSPEEWWEYGIAIEKKGLERWRSEQKQRDSSS